MDSSALDAGSQALRVLQKRQSNRQFMPAKQGKREAGAFVDKCADCRGYVVDRTNAPVFSISKKPPAGMPPPAPRPLMPAPPRPAVSQGASQAGPSTYHPRASPNTIAQARTGAKRARQERYEKLQAVREEYQEIDEDHPPPPVQEPWFLCDACGVPRQSDDRWTEDYCIYCSRPGEEDPYTDRKWCVQGEHIARIIDFFSGTLDGNVLNGTENDWCCIACQTDTPFETPLPGGSNPSTNFTQSMPSTPGAHFSSTPGLSTPSGDIGIQYSQQSTVSGAVKRMEKTHKDRERKRREDLFINHQEPPYAPIAEQGLEAALTDEDHALLEDFQQALDADVMQHCPRYNEKWWIKLNKEGVCLRYENRDRSRLIDEPYLFSAENNMDPAQVPVDDNANTDNADEQRTTRQFTKGFNIRRWAVLAWLEHLKEHHPGYADIQDQGAAGRPEQGPVANDDQPGEDLGHDYTAVAFTGAEETAVDQLPNRIRVQQEARAQNNDPQGNRLDAPYRSSLSEPEYQPTARPNREEEQPSTNPMLTFPKLEEVPLSEFDKDRPPLSLAFPTLFPYGKGDPRQPRIRAVTDTVFIQHLMRYHDGRFAQHSRFPFHALTPQVPSRKLWPIHTPVNYRFYSTPSLEPAQISVAPVPIGSRTQNLICFVLALGKPDIFITLSAADVQWFSTASHMPDFERWLTLPPDERARLARENLKNNPHVADAHFERRFKLFLEKVLKPKFNVVDYCAKQMNKSKTVLQFSSTELTGTQAELADVVNRVQCHIHSGYCQAKKRKVKATTGEELGGAEDSDQMGCRFYFPRQQRTEAVIDKDHNAYHLSFIAACNDPDLHHFNRLVSSCIIHGASTPSALRSSHTFFPSDGDKERPFYRWSNAYEYCQIGGECPKDHGQDDYYGDIPDGDLDEFEQPERPVEGDPAYFQEVVNGNAIRDEDPDNLGDREMDRAANWASKINTYIKHPEIHDNAEVDWWESHRLRRTVAINSRNRTAEPTSASSLRHGAQALQQPQRRPQPEALRINIDGPTGTGKSFLINLLSARLQQAVANENQPNPIQRLAPTGSAAHNINSSIVHSYLSIPPEQAQNLQSVLKVSIGCRLMLLTNLWTEHGLVDGRQGTLYDIVWPANTDRETVREQMPLCLLVEIEGLQDSCPELFKTNAGDKVVPVFPLRRKLYSQARGMTLDKAVVNLDQLEHTAGLTYVAVSRVRTFDGLMFETAFDYSRIRESRILGNPFLY
ncbi:uncharacterized protein MYCGRDRAFT_97535 [Zymoseptoria tritici IPO323]|uniref:Helitron helicase-like domain-containing protein n=1 Tax=Zymoseptoria tritici (strain CBS 115943 / IPO323) TaxID=336722 RepID=F9XQI9_ZYMTI|nr:uncharacterized protein MYCGRDRAFT_97535 [Zymoseptoria tritici IPO323]EGP82368.1 hypothetical protein MYCGRDRAFT_97535 [Zymoseptoria tritici IPO323]